MNLQHIISQRAQITANLAQTRADFEATVKAAELRLAALGQAERLILAGLDVEKIERGKAVIRVYGRVTAPNSGWDGRGDGADARARLVEEAKVSIAEGGSRLRAGYFGIKNYEAFGDQRSDHGYGFGPRHGEIVFSVALQQSERTSGHAVLRPGQIDDALYYLSVLPQIEATLEPKVPA
ncbi:MAG: hypothetical protein DI527_00530 [Chelatococcus sp.]|nr:MAG: hypothetical protein DI527_00530 [Chelatococcus sp.]